MRKNYFILSLCALTLLISCKKQDVVSALPIGSISINGLATADSVVRTVSLAKDTVITVSIKAVSEKPVLGTQLLRFAADTTALASYHDKYGTALLLPSRSYFFYQPDCSILDGATLSGAAEVNIIKQSSLRPYTTYVLPLAVQSLQHPETIKSGQLFYVVVQTGKATFLSKEDWKIVGASSGLASAKNLLDNDDQTTTWMTDFGAMAPYNVVIDFGEELTFSGVSYRSPSSYYNLGAWIPTSIKIELSNNGVDWTNKGNFPGQTSDATQIIDTGISTARYMRFNVLTVSPFSGLNILILGGINLVP